MGVNVRVSAGVGSQKVFFPGAAVADVEKIFNQFAEDFDVCLIELSASSREVHDLPTEEAGEHWPLDLFAASGTVVSCHSTGLMRFE